MCFERGVGVPDLDLGAGAGPAAADARSRWVNPIGSNAQRTARFYCVHSSEVLQPENSYELLGQMMASFYSLAFQGTSCCWRFWREMDLFAGTRPMSRGMRRWVLNERTDNLQIDPPQPLARICRRW